MPKVTITLDLTEAEERALLDNSIERVMRNGERVCLAGARARNHDISERASTYLDDVEALCPLTSKLWDRARDAVFRQRNKLEPQQ